MVERQSKAPPSARKPNEPSVTPWAFLALLVSLLAAGCAPVRPEQRAILADRIMQFGADARERAALEHALENREGSVGAGSVQGGGCGCN
ncbi:MAG TPA: DUF4266 domain-containing protein [Polyangiaceae bacterium]|nr:DUF4266 domain-containing protein [Polyangiaceae bacterium]